MGKSLLFLILLATLTAHSQDRERISFSKAVERNIKEYTKKSEAAYHFQNFEHAEFLFDSIIDHVVKGSYIDNFTVKKRSGKKIELYQFKKPIILITYASWCTPGKGEIPALNKIAKKYHKDIDFVVLFWDSKRSVKKSTRKYSNKIKILYVDEKENRDDHIVRIMKHSFGIPTTYFIDKNKRIVDLRRSVIHHYNEEFETSFQSNYNSFLNGVSLLKNFLESERIASDKTGKPKEL